MSSKSFGSFGSLEKAVSGPWSKRQSLVERQSLVPGRKNSPGSKGLESMRIERNDLAKLVKLLTRAEGKR
jgi:hypothetical protein